MNTADVLALVGSIIAIAVPLVGLIWYIINHRSEWKKILLAGAIAVIIIASLLVGVNIAVGHTGGDGTQTPPPPSRSTFTPSPMPFHGVIVEFKISDLSYSPLYIAAGSDQRLWFTTGTTKLGRIGTNGSFSPTVALGGDSYDLVVGPRDDIWCTEFAANKLGHIDSVGSLKEFPLGTPNSYPVGITLGRDGNIWFTEGQVNRIGRIDPIFPGTISEFSVGEFPNVQAVDSITQGPDNALWFTEKTKIGRITYQGAIQEFPVPTTAVRTSIVTGSDGNLWFSEGGLNAIGRLTPKGDYHQFLLPSPASDPETLVAGPDGNIWFTETTGNRVGFITPSGAITEYPLPTPGSKPLGIAVGPDRNLWFTEVHGIGRISP